MVCAPLCLDAILSDLKLPFWGLWDQRFIENPKEAVDGRRVFHS